ncbi:MAG TPA: GMC family oxidoreductase [Thermoanaerobaculia bacterium]|nr:GMC family oxidoreductase [Thermoanaerobaculia bacterium]
MAESFDAIIIGSGAGGAPIAHTLANAGKRVLVLEKGPVLRPQYQRKNGISDFKRDELYATGTEKRIQVPGMANFNGSYYSSHVEPDLNDEPHVYDKDGTDFATIEGYTAQVVGGGTQLYGGVSLRFTPRDLSLKSFNEGRQIDRDPNGDIKREARDWPYTYDDLEPWYTMAETLVGINGTQENQVKKFSDPNSYQPPLTPNPISTHVEQGMDALGMKRYRTPLAVITRDHAPSGRKVPKDPEEAKTSYVNRYGDPLGLKSSTWVSLLSPIEEKFELRANSVVTHLESDGAKVTKVHYRDGAGNPRVVEGKIVVVACSAIESVRLLKLSGLLDQDFNQRINASGLLGNYFLTHSFGGASAYVANPKRYDKSISLDSDWATDFCGSDDFLNEKKLWAGGAIYNNTSDRALPLSLARTHRSQDLDSFWKGFTDNIELTGEALRDFLLLRLGRGLSVSFMANQVPLKTNRIELHPTVTDKWNRPVAYIRKRWHEHDIYLMDVLAEQCAEILRKGATLEEGHGGVYAGDTALARCANHILGGARFGTDPKDSVLDVWCRAWEFDNLYVTDGAFMPTAGGANPTLTIQANAFRVADELTRRI